MHGDDGKCLNYLMVLPFESVKVLTQISGCTLRTFLHLLIYNGCSWSLFEAKLVRCVICAQLAVNVEGQMWSK